VLREIRRVLVPGGQVCIGGGFGSLELREEIIRKMRLKEAEWQPKCRGFDDSVYLDAIAAAGISGAEILKNESGTWITFQKPLDLFPENLAVNFTTASEYK